MCGIAVATGPSAPRVVHTMCERLHHRGPDGEGVWSDATIAFGHRRLSILDLSDAGRQPMVSSDGRYVLTFNGEIYNHEELRAELSAYPFRSRSDTEVVLAAWSEWGEASLDRFIGMFALAIWDTREHELVAVRDRFGVKPLLHASLPGGQIVLASEIKAIHAAGVVPEPDAVAWATYLVRGASDHSSRTFWKHISAVPAGCLLRWRPGGKPSVRRWYDLAANIGQELDTRDRATVVDEYLQLLRDSVKLRFRADVPVGINLSGGLDSSILLGLVQEVRGPQNDVKAFSFVTGDDRYDELPWVKMMLAHTRHPLIACELRPEQVPLLADHITGAADEPFGGIPTLAYARLFQRAREEGVIVLLDGQGLDEQWAGYDYYRSTGPAPVVQGSEDRAVLPECLTTEFAALAEGSTVATPFRSRLRDLQFRDLTATKIPRALRYNDRVSMAASTELREPFLDHRLVELALRQADDRKVAGDVGKVLLRELAKKIVPESVRTAPKRPLQTPQREWLRGELSPWADERIEAAFAQTGWFNAKARPAWHRYRAGHGDNSHWVWQWISAGMLTARGRANEV